MFIRMLVCGGRDYSDREWLFRMLDDVQYNEGPITCVIHGDARGADRFAGEWAEARGIPVEKYPADWKQGKSAGFIRNSHMLKHGKPDIVVAFPGGSGTKMMIGLAEAAGVKVIDGTPSP